MAVTSFAKGRIKAILYFQNERGMIQMLPTDEMTLKYRKVMRRNGFEMMAAETLAQSEALQQKLQAQLKAEQDRELTQDEMMTAQGRSKVGERLRRRLASSLTSEYEKDFIRCYLMWRENKHEIFKRKFSSEVGHLDALEFDKPNQKIIDRMDRV